MLFGGILLILIAIVLIVMHVSTRKRIAYLLSARDSTPGELASTAAKLTEEIGEGGFTEFVTLAGQAEATQPLTSPLGQRPSLYYRMKVERRYEEDYTTTDSQGKTQRRTRTGSETMSTQEESCDFFLRGADGAMRVQLDGAQFEGLVQTVDRFEPSAGGMSGGSLSFGRFSMSLGNMSQNRRTLGYQYTEHILPVNQELTVIGQVDEKRGGGLSIGRGGLAFIVSTQSKQSLLGGSKKSAQMTSIASGVCLVAGIVLTLIGAFS